MLTSGYPDFVILLLFVCCAVSVGMTLVTVMLLRDVSRLEARARTAERQVSDRAENSRDMAAPALERAEAAVEAKARFLATVSHEIRTPLNGVLGMADLLADTQVDAEQRTYVEAIKTSGEALLSLIDEILDFSKIEAGKLDFNPEPFDLTGMVEGVAELMAPRAQGKDIEIAVFVAGDVPSHVVSDAARLRQVLLNLAGNAIKFTEKGGVGLRVTRLEGARLRFEVNDSGIGIPPERLETVFAEFEQVDNSHASRFGGTGLGLAISRRIVEGLGGIIHVESRIGEGSCFAFELDCPAAPASEAEKPAALDLTGENFLVVAASRFEVPYLILRLQEAGASARQVADSAAAAHALVAGTSVTGIIVDCALGAEETRTIAQAAAQVGIARRLVMLSPYERRAFGPPGAAGFNGYLVKPVRKRSLFARLDPEHPRKAEPEQPALNARLTPAGTRILLAEDNDINALLVLRLLEKIGCSTAWAKDGLEAVRLFEQTATGSEGGFGVVLMDMRMPGLDGLEAARRIRTFEAAANLPRARIVALTANAFDDDRKSCLDAGMDAFVAKPLDLSRLVNALGLQATGLSGTRQTA